MEEILRQSIIGDRLRLEILENGMKTNYTDLGGNPKLTPEMLDAYYDREKERLSHPSSVALREMLDDGEPQPDADAINKDLKLGL